jgi:hypothetical protein
LYFDFTSAADPVVFLVIFLNESRIVRQCVLHSPTVKMERKYLNIAKFSFFSKAFLLVLLLQTFVLLVLAIGATNFLIVITDFWLLGSRTDL